MNELLSQKGMVLQNEWWENEMSNYCVSAKQWTHQKKIKWFVENMTQKCKHFGWLNCVSNIGSIKKRRQKNGIDENEKEKTGILLWMSILGWLKNLK